MPIGEYCNREVVIAGRECSIEEAAIRMREHHVGNLVVVEAEGSNMPVGILTDRDIVVAVVAKGLDPTTLTAGDVVSRELASVREDEGFFDTIRRMRQHGVRRLPVVDAAGALVGIVTFDDVVELLAEELSETVKVVPREQNVEARVRR